MYDKLVAALVAVPVLYFAWYLTWLGTFATTCPMGDPDSLEAGIILSFLPYLVAMISLWFGRLPIVGLIASLPLFPLALWQVDWSFRLFLVLNVNGRNACNLIMGEEFGDANGWLFEHLYAPYYLLAGLGTVGAVMYSHWRHRQLSKVSEAGCR